jgi:tetratricopeptide (TPR) repeat protein
MAQNAFTTPGLDVAGRRFTMRTVQVCVATVPFLLLPSIEEFIILPKLLFLQICMFASLVAWMCRPVWKNRSPLLLPALGFLLILAASPLWAVNPFRATYDLSKYVTFLLFFVLLLHTLEKPQIHGILRISAAAGALAAAIGILEYHAIIPEWIPSTGRPSSTFGFRNMAAFYLIANTPLVILFGLTSRNRTDRMLGGLSTGLMLIFLLYTRARASWVGISGAAYLTLSLWTYHRLQSHRRYFLCFSVLNPALVVVLAVYPLLGDSDLSHLTKILLACALVGTLVGWGVLTLGCLWDLLKPIVDRQIAAVSLATILVVVILGFLPAGVQESHVQRFDEKKADVPSALASMAQRGGDRDRFYMWSRTILMMADRPLLGVGLGNWEFVFPLYDEGRMIRPEHAPNRPHNDILWVGSETGIVGLLGYTLVLGTFVLLVIRIWRRTESVGDQLTGICCCISVFAVVGAGQFSFPSERVPPSMLYWFSFAVVGIYARNPSGSDRTLRPATLGKTLVVLSLPIILLCIGITVRNILFDYHYIKTVIAFVKKQHAIVVDKARLALQHGPFDHQVFIMLGDGLLNLQNYEEAIRVFERGLRYHPNFSNTYSNLGLVHDRMDENEEALRYYQKAVEIAPVHHVAYYNLGTLYQKLGQFDEAIVAYRRGFRNHHTQPYVNLGVIYHQQGMLDSVISVSNRALFPGYESFEAYMNLGRAHADKKEYEKAIVDYNSFLRLYKGENEEFIQAAKQELAGAYSGMGVQAENRGKADRAVELYQIALKMQPDLALHWFNLGNGYRQKNASNEAVHAFQKALALDSSNVNIYNNLGMTYNDLGEHRKAMATFLKGSKLEPDQPIIRYNIGNTHLDLGEKDLSLESYALFRKLWQGDPTSLSYHMGNAYQKMGDIPKAIESFEAFMKGYKGDRAFLDSVKRILEQLKGH